MSEFPILMRFCRDEQVSLAAIPCSFCLWVVALLCFPSLEKRIIVASIWAGQIAVVSAVQLLLMPGLALQAAEPNNDGLYPFQIATMSGASLDVVFTLYQHHEEQVEGSRARLKSYSSTPS
jgi:hypothetical protein